MQHHLCKIRCNLFLRGTRPPCEHVPSHREALTQDRDRDAREGGKRAPYAPQLMRENGAGVALGYAPAWAAGLRLAGCEALLQPTLFISALWEHRGCHVGVEGLLKSWSFMADGRKAVPGQVLVTFIAQTQGADSSMHSPYF